MSGGSEIGSGSELGGGYREARDVVRSSVVNPVMVKTIELRERQNKDKIKIRFHYITIKGL